MFLFRTRPAVHTDKEATRSSQSISIDEALSAGPASMPERPRNQGSQSLPHVADMAKNPGRKVSGIRAAFERSNNKRTTPSPPKPPQSPTKKHASTTEDRVASHDAKMALLTEELDKERAQRKELESQTTSLKKEAETLRAELNRKDAYWREELRNKLHEAKQEGGGPGHGMHSSRNKPRLADNDGLQRQLTDLKRSISKSTRVETVVTADSTIAQEMGSLAHEVQNWVVNHYRKTKVGADAKKLEERLVSLVNKQQLERLQPIRAGWKSENKIAVLQSTIAAILVDVFDDQLLFGMPPQEEWASDVRNTAHHLSKMLDHQQYNKWRATTLDIIRQTGAMKAAADSAAGTMAEYITSTIDTLTGAESSGTKLSSLQTIVKRAITLAHLLRIQRASFSVVLPSPLTPFDLKRMENVAFDRDAEEGHPIDIATFPAVLKSGDEHGDNAQWQNVVMKANVVCGES